jgi:DNA-directed RNA polymerase specialized sigma subunit
MINSLEDQIINKENNKRLTSLMKKLPNFYELVILEYYFNNKTLKQIAKKYHKSAPWINVVRHRSLNFLTAYMKNDKDISEIQLNDFWRKKVGSLTNWGNFNPKFIK